MSQPAPRALEPDLSRHMPALDGIRGLAILAVCVYHITFIATPERPNHAWISVTSFGWAGVDLFFALSGFLITGILLDSKGSSHYFRNFYVRRVLRIFPLYYAVLTACLILPRLHLAPAHSLGKAAASPGWYWLYLCNFAMARHNDFGSGPLAVCWSLAIEEQFYLLWPALVLLLSRRQLIAACVGAGILALGTRIWLDRAGWGWVGIYVLTPCRIDSLAAGALVAALIRGPGGVKRLLPAFRIAAGTFAVLLIVLLCVQHASWTERAPARVLGYTLLAGFCASLLPISISLPRAHPAGRILSGRFMRVFGRYSYAMYLFHPIVLAGVYKVMKHARVPTLLGTDLPWQLLFSVVAVGATVLAARVSWVVFESPILRLKRFFPVERESALRAAPSRALVQDVTPAPARAVVQADLATANRG